MRATFAANCAAVDRSEDAQLQFSLPAGAAMLDDSWQVCFNSRGLPNANIQITLSNQSGETRVVEVFLGGAVKEI